MLLCTYGNNGYSNSGINRGTKKIFFSLLTGIAVSMEIKKKSLINKIFLKPVFLTINI